MKHSLESNNEFNLQLALLASLAPADYTPIKRMTIDTELKLFRNELTESAKQRMLERKKAEREKISINDRHYNIQSLLNNNFIIDLLPQTFKFLPLESMFRMQLVCHKFYSSIQSAMQSDMIYIDSDIVDKLFTSNIRAENKLMQLIWSNVQIIHFKCPGMYGLEQNNKLRQSTPPTNTNPPTPKKLSKLIVEVSYPYQLNFLSRLDLTKVHLIIKCCSDELCWICQYELIKQTCSTISRRCCRYTLYHNNKLIKH